MHHGWRFFFLAECYFCSRMRFSFRSTGTSSQIGWSCFRTQAFRCDRSLSLSSAHAACLWIWIARYCSAAFNPGTCCDAPVRLLFSWLARCFAVFQDKKATANTQPDMIYVCRCPTSRAPRLSRPLGRPFRLMPQVFQAARGNSVAQVRRVILWQRNLGC